MSLLTCARHLRVRSTTHHLHVSNVIIRLVYDPSGDSVSSNGDSVSSNGDNSDALSPVML